MKFYIIGSLDLSNLPDTIKKFHQAIIEITQAGHEVINESFTTTPWGTDPEMDTIHRMRGVCTCDAAFVLPDWSEDKVAQIELVMACKMGKKLKWERTTHIPDRIVFYTNIAEHKTVDNGL